MQTYSHYILTALLNRKLKERTTTEGQTVGLQMGGLALPPLQTPALMVGSVAPDLSLILLTIVFIISDQLAGRSFGPASGAESSNVEYLFDYLFFHNQWVMTLHNLFHGPVMIIFYLATGYWGWRRGRRWGAALFWFALACTLHTLIDIPLHTDDGPLLLFPLNFAVRYRSPISYWDPAYYGNLWAPFEHLLIFGVLIYLIWDWWRKRRARARMMPG
jgi:hypothetical protein